MIATIFLALAGLYLLCGIIFAVPFVIVGVGRIDPHATRGSWGFRVFILPGTMLLWPFLRKRWLHRIHEPPEEKTAHRLNAKCRVQNGECLKPGGSGVSVSRTMHSTL